MRPRAIDGGGPSARHPSDVAKALSHPLRVSILQELEHGVASPKALAGRLGQPLPLVSYHVKILARLGCVELVDTVPRRGAVEHFYRPLRRAELSADEWAELPPSVREGLSGTALRDISRELAAAADAGTLDGDRDRHLSLTHLELDEEGWAAVGAALDDLVALALRREAEAKAAGVARVRAALVLAQFERATDPTA